MLIDTFPIPTLPFFLTCPSSTFTRSILPLTDGRLGESSGFTLFNHSSFLSPASTLGLIPTALFFKHALLSKLYPWPDHYRCHSLTLSPTDPCARSTLIHIFASSPSHTLRPVRAHHSPLYSHSLPTARSAFRIYFFAPSLFFRPLLYNTPARLRPLVDRLGSSVHTERQLHFTVQFKHTTTYMCTIGCILCTTL